MKTTLKFEEPEKSIYRDYSNFSSGCFKDDFDDDVQHLSGKSRLQRFRKKTIDTLNKRGRSFC